MSPETLMIETMNAAGNENLPKWHKELIVKGEEFAKIDEVSLFSLYCLSGSIRREGTMMNDETHLDSQCNLLELGN